MLVRAGGSATRARILLPSSSTRALLTLTLARPSASSILLAPPLRPLSTIPTSFTPGGPDPPSLYPPEPPRRSATAEFYRALVPAMLHCLALGSIVYYALELGWMWLKREKEAGELRERVGGLEEELEVERSRGAGGSTKGVGERGEGRGSWWKLW
ncbi:hypothetical protein JCM6882_007783 [Rhodosporidiobolus microsporus]